VIRRPADVLAFARTPGAQKFIKYSAVSVIAVIVGEVSLIFFQLALGFSPGWANLAQACVATVPSYILNRRWAWGKTGKGHLWREVVPFWVLSFIGLAVSEVTAIVAGNYASSHHWSRSGKGYLVAVVVLLSYGVLWVGKFIIINKVLFVDHPADIEPAFDGRSGLPT
jgi:putative flippase GtrA